MSEKDVNVIIKQNDLVKYHQVISYAKNVGPVLTVW